MYCMECRKYVGLTLTWDVLKQYPSDGEMVDRLRLTLTWDVLKLEVYAKKALKNYRLTLTWDVLKLSRMSFWSVSGTD